MAIRHYQSIGESTRTEDFPLQVSRGLVGGHRTITVFGFNPDVDQTQVSVWPLPLLHTHMDAAEQVKVSSTNANDTSAGTGARTICIQGLDASYNEITETVTLNGTTPVTTTNTFIAINFAYVATAGSLKCAAGDIYIGSGVVTGGIPATIHEIIKYDYNNTITARYTIPANHTGYLVQGLFSCGQAVGSTSVEGRLISHGVNSIKMTAAVTTINNGVANYQFEYPLKITEKTYIEATAIGTSNNNSVSAMFIVVLVANDET